MPLPQRITTFNRDLLNPVMLRLAGHGPFAELEHVGRRSGRTYRTPLMAFRYVDRDAGTRAVTIALTYGPHVQWLGNVTAAGGARMRLRGERLTLGAPRRLDADEGLARIPNPQRAVLRHVIHCHDLVELPVLDRELDHGTAPSPGR